MPDKDNNFSDRMARVKQATGWSWTQLAHELGIARSMLFYYLKGTYPPSKDCLGNLGLIEQRLGQELDTSQNIVLLKDGNSPTDEQQHWKPRRLLMPHEVEKGSFETKLRFRTAKPPEGCPNTMVLNRPPLDALRKVVFEIEQTKTFRPALMACLPVPQANQRFLEALNPLSYLELEDAAMALVFGIHWHREVQPLLFRPGQYQALLKESERQPETGPSPTAAQASEMPLPTPKPLDD